MHAKSVEEAVRRLHASMARLDAIRSESLAELAGKSSGTGSEVYELASGHPDYPNLPDDDSRFLSKEDDRTFFCRLWDWLDGKVTRLRCACRDFRCGIRAIRAWASVIWHDRQWDSVFLYSILEHKLSLIQRSTDAWSSTQAAEQKVLLGCLIDLCRFVVLLTDSDWEADENLAAEEAAIDHEYGGVLSWTTPSDRGEGWRRYHLARRNVLTQERAAAAHRAEIAFYEHCSEALDTARKELFAALNKELPWLWD